MKREIKFRGKMVDSDNWMYGYLREVWGENQRNFVIAPAKRFEYDGYADMDEDYVQIDTIGQFTGLKDKNGKEIYEGDIVKRDNNEYTYVCKWVDKYACFVFEENKEYGDYSYFQQCDKDRLEVIGNIYDNKELLED